MMDSCAIYRGCCPTYTAAQLRGIPPQELGPLILLMKERHAFRPSFA